MPYTYIIKNEQTGKYYIGSCNDLNVRLYHHNHRKTRSTKSGVLWKIVYSEEFASKGAAYRREQQIKSYKGGEAFKKN